MLPVYMLQMLIGNAHYHCFCVRYVASDNPTLALIIGLSAALGVLLIIASVVGVTCYKRCRRDRAGKTVDKNGQELKSVGEEFQPYEEIQPYEENHPYDVCFPNSFKENDQQYQHRLPSENHSPR